MHDSLMTIFTENPTTNNGDSSTVAAESSTSLKAAAMEPEVSVTTESDGLTTPSNLPGKQKYFNGSIGDHGNVLEQHQRK